MTFFRNGNTATFLPQGITFEKEKYFEVIKIPQIDAKRLMQLKEKMTSEELTLPRWVTGAINWTVRATRVDLVFEMIDASTLMQAGTNADLSSYKNNGEAA